jgi:hypothetical protein
VEKFKYGMKKLLSLWLILAGIHVAGISVALLQSNTIDIIAFLSLLSCAIVSIFNKK